MKTIVYSTKPYEKRLLLEYNESNFENVHEFEFIEAKLNKQTARLAQGFESICVFVNDDCNAQVVEMLAQNGIKLIVLRCAGFNNVDLEAAEKNNIKVVRVPQYSPYAVAEHAVALLMAVNRKTHRAYSRVKENNFSLNGLMGFDIHGKTLGVIGTGKIGKIFMKIMKGFGVNILAYDLYPDEEFAKENNIKYTSLEEIYKNSDIISLHTPLTEDTYHLLNKNVFKQMKSNCVILNTSRGKLIDTSDLIEALKDKEIGGAGLDVYEEEEHYFFEDLSDEIICDDELTRLTTFPNVLITSHQAFFTQEALYNIINTSLQNIVDFNENKELVNQVK